MASGTSPTIGESSSSQTLWATASKEWVILPKPKPGRKPKKDSVSQSSEGDTASRRTQNRAAQRAFRERKQSQLAELQARIQSYENGEIERNVALQKVAKRLKDENQLLREENGVLKARVAELEARVEMDVQVMPIQNNDLLPTDKKRSRDLSSPPNSQTPHPHVSKKTRDGTADYTSHDPFPTDAVPSFPSSLGCNTVDQFSPLPYVPRHDDPSFLTCGFCEADTLCVCREISCPSPMEHSVDSTTFNSTAEKNNSAPANVQSLDRRNESMNIDKKPIYEPAVPIRRRNKGVPPNSIFPVHEPSPPERVSEATCSGDPNDCLACADDSFGQAFCAAIGNSSPNCGCSAQIMSGCCGSSSRCLDCPVSPSERSRPVQMETMPTNDAWQKLKAHPNVQFADLTLLAEVVARKSRCDGPQLVISSTPHSHSDKSQSKNQSDGNVTSTHQGDDSPPPRLAPHELLLECGRKRMRQVRSDGVREALRLLDAKFS